MMGIHKIESGNTPWHCVAKWATSWRKWTVLVKAGRRWLELHMLPVITLKCTRSTMIWPVKWLSQTGWRAMWNMRHEMTRFWHWTDISSMWFTSYRAIHNMRKWLKRFIFPKRKIKGETVRKMNEHYKDSKKKFKKKNKRNKQIFVLSYTRKEKVRREPKNTNKMCTNNPLKTQNILLWKLVTGKSHFMNEGKSQVTNFSFQAVIQLALCSN